MRNLTDHFTLEELCRSEAAIRKGLDNTPPLEIVANIQQTAEALEIVRAHFGAPIHVTSCYRSGQVNAAVGGSLTSAHRYGLAADFEVDGVANIDVCRWIRDNLTVDQVIYEFGPAGWVHMGIRRNGHTTPRRQALTAIREAGTTVYRPGIVDLWNQGKG